VTETRGCCRVARTALARARARAAARGRTNPGARLDRKPRNDLAARKFRTALSDDVIIRIRWVNKRIASDRDVGGPLWIAPGDTLFSQNIADITGLYGQGSSPMATHLGASPRFLSDADRRQRGGAVSTSICIDVGTHGCIASCLTGPIASLDESSAFSARDVAGGLECANSDTHVAGAVGVFMHCAIARLESDLPACQHLRKKWIC